MSRQNKSKSKQNKIKTKQNKKFALMYNVFSTACKLNKINRGFIFIYIICTTIFSVASKPSCVKLRHRFIFVMEFSSQG